jgi:hypothetical protein
MNAPAMSRIVVALDPAGRGDFALEMAAFVSGDDALEIVGLFVEDTRLIEHARSPVAREVAFSGHERSLDLQSLERQIRAQASEARRRFETAAAKLGVRHAFQIARGEVLAEVSREAADAELLVVSFGVETRLRGGWGAPLEQLVRARLPALLFARESAPSGGVLVVLETSVQAVAALTTAVRLAKRGRAPLMVLATTAVLGDPDVDAVLVAEGSAAPTLVAAERITAETIARAARGARLVILPSREAAADESLIGTLLAQLRAPLMLVRDRTSASH